MRGTSLWSQLQHGHVLHDGTGWSLVQCSFESVDRLPISFGANFDPAIVEIADEAGEALTHCRCADEETVAHALDPPGNQKLTRDYHRSTEM